MCFYSSLHNRRREVPRRAAGNFFNFFNFFFFAGGKQQNIHLRDYSLDSMPYICGGAVEESSTSSSSLELEQFSAT